jgi:hypothetical protein
MGQRSEPVTEGEIRGIIGKIGKAREGVSRWVAVQMLFTLDLSGSRAPTIISSANLPYLLT